MKEKRINKYYSACYPSHIEIASRFKNENGDRNENYIHDLLANYERKQEAEIYQKNSLESDIHKRLKQENKLICMFFSDVFKLYDAVCDYKNTRNRNIINRINRYEFDVEQRFIDLDYHSLFIARLVDENRIKEAVEVKRFLDNNFKNLVNHFSSYLGIKLKESPLKRKVLSYQKQLESSINFEELKALGSEKISNINQNSNSENSNKEVFSVKVWCYAFYYWEKYSEKKTIKDKIEHFLECFDVKTQNGEKASPLNFKNTFYKVKKELRFETSTKPEQILINLQNILKILPVNSKPFNDAKKEINYCKEELD
ncbi:hypothetical protein BTO06_17545 [Tenacibaculum sp. SZ-18]|uniref:hypothetical protein n=1 Tax=Tenacibaculum sp. SZ-18 TaxID=754423 RepID=UPI000C2D067D|nr:hypothetical protein [Tenacibaculum sp. SZ-18]AUC16837.1 hypothetical protein BTO06_17545 [Tenacibaculum sp. SZ-18]